MGVPIAGTYRIWAEAPGYRVQPELYEVEVAEGETILTLDFHFTAISWPTITSINIPEYGYSPRHEFRGRSMLMLISRSSMSTAFNFARGS